MWMCMRMRSVIPFSQNGRQPFLCHFGCEWRPLPSSNAVHKSDNVSRYVTLESNGIILHFSRTTLSVWWWLLYVANSIHSAFCEFFAFHFLFYSVRRYNGGTADESMRGVHVVSLAALFNSSVNGIFFFSTVTWLTQLCTDARGRKERASNE